MNSSFSDKALSGRKALVFAASQGLGKASAEMLASMGAEVVIDHETWRAYTFSHCSRLFIAGCGVGCLFDRRCCGGNTSIFSIQR